MNSTRTHARQPCNVALLRMTLNLTQHAMAKELGVAVGTVYRWEATGHAPLWLAAWAAGYLALRPARHFDQAQLPAQK